ncbi:uncharacterized protein C8R40DRAFT_237217 [Lentinula edodes]|uniref:uncharacterized protein n=1 Tax=Lentinula edodes TaxID=5353 RepID=UPI001E8D0E0E|nr:uncharacterized protein C8R40DRAFT_237217 [Lentinula edodes]KAH7874932.1 hypothetical protein C8R40DRAFT_237217 [Lentinula edodes]
MIILIALSGFASLGTSGLGMVLPSFWTLCVNFGLFRHRSCVDISSGYHFWQHFVLIGMPDFSAVSDDFSGPIPPLGSDFIPKFSLLHYPILLHHHLLQLRLLIHGFRGLKRTWGILLYSSPVFQFSDRLLPIFPNFGTCFSLLRLQNTFRPARTSEVTWSSILLLIILLRVYFVSIWFLFAL